jgi:transketolase
MPCAELFAEQDAAYRASVLPADMPRRLSVEAAATFGWERWVGCEGESLGIDRFGMSAPGEQVAAELGISVESIVARGRALAGKGA